jgi:hypothetical protein
VTAEQCPDGSLDSLSHQDIADEIFFEGDPELLISALTESGFLDATEHGLVVHGWSERAENGIHAALAKKTLLFADGTMPKIPHEWFSSSTRDRIKAEYAQRYPDKVPEESRQCPDKSGQVPTKPSLANKPSHQTKPNKQDKNTSEHAEAPRVPTLDECRAYALERFNLNGAFADRFHEVNAEKGWKDKDGKPYQNWKNLMRVWVDKEGNLDRYTPAAKPDNSLVKR